MPLNREALTLEQTPSAATAARRWVAQVCEALDRDDLTECARLGVSELVTNAILHGEGPIEVRVRGTVAHPRIEVFDASRHPPVCPGHGPNALLSFLDEPVASSEGSSSGGSPESSSSRDDLTTYGRGLMLVAMAAEAWGAAIEDHGKVVWFEPAPALHESPSDGVIENHSSHEWEPLPEAMTVKLVGLDIALMGSVLTHYNNLRREIRLLSVAHDETYPLARDLSPMFATFERQFPPSTLAMVARQIATNTAEGNPTMQLDFVASPRSTHIYRAMIDVMDLADDFCRREDLLSLARTPEQHAKHVWILEEFARQGEGLEPRPWGTTESSSPFVVVT